MINYDFWQGQGQGQGPVQQYGGYVAPNAGIPDVTIPSYGPTPYGAGPGGGGPVYDPVSGVPPGGFGPPTPAGPMGYGNFNFPSAWSGLEDFYGNLMGGGMNMPLPGLWGAGSDRLQQMMQTGEPVDISGILEAKRPVYRQAYEDEVYQMLEQAGLGGTRESSGAQRQVAESGRRYMQDYTAMAAQLKLAADEAAKARVMASMGMIPDYVAQSMQQKLMNLQAQMAGAEGMMGFGQQQMFAPLELARGMMGLGQGYMGAEQGMYNNMMNDPYLQLALSMGSGSQYMPQQYQPGWGSQMMNMGSSLMSPWMWSQYMNPTSPGGGNMQLNPYYGNMFNNPYGG
jgi:hypothetical protein